jgi:hypothetical protein
VELVRWCRLQWDRVLGVAAMAVGVIMLLVGWAKVSGTEFVAVQVPYVVSAGLGGLVAMVIGATLWLSADLRDEFRALDRIESALQDGDDELAALAKRVAGLEGNVVSEPNGARGARARGRA